MKISDNTKEILKNFSEINPNLLIQSGKVVKTISTMKNILATAGVEEDFPRDIPIYDLSEFLGMISLFSKPTFTFEDKYMTMQEEGTSTNSKYFYADPSILTTPQKDVKLPDTEVEFTLTEADLIKVKKAAAMLQLPDISVKSVDGAIMMSAVDKKNETANTYGVKVGDTDKSFDFHFKVEHFKMLPGDYGVYISSKLISNFRHKNKTLQYWVALENTSKYEG